MIIKNNENVVSEEENNNENVVTPSKKTEEFTVEQLSKAIFKYCTGCWGGNKPEKVESCDNIFCVLHQFRLISAPPTAQRELVITSNVEVKKKKNPKISDEDQKIIDNKKKAIPKK